MASVMKEFGKILRYYVCGYVFILTTMYTYNNDIVYWLKLTKNFKFSSVLIIAPLVLGSLIHTVHRNSLNVLMEWLRILVFGGKEILVSRQEWEGFKIRWELNNGTSVAIANIRSWGDHIFLLYNSSIAIIFGSFFAKIIDTRDNASYGFSGYVLAVCIALYAVGFFPDIRKHTVEIKLNREFKGVRI